MGQRDYSIRAWLDPQKLASRNMTAGDVANAIRSQNLAAALGQIGQPPAEVGQTFQVPIDTLGRLTTPEQFGDIIVKVAQNRVNIPALAAIAVEARGWPALPGSISPSQNFATWVVSAARGSCNSNIGGGDQLQHWHRVNTQPRAAYNIGVSGGTPGAHS